MVIFNYMWLYVFPKASALRLHHLHVNITAAVFFATYRIVNQHIIKVPHSGTAL